MNNDSASDTPPIDHLQVLLQSHLIKEFKCITKFVESNYSSVALSSFNHGYQVYLHVPSITTSRLTRTCTPNVSPNSVYHRLQIRRIESSKSITKLSWLQLPGASLTLRGFGLQAHVQTHSIMAPKCNSKITWFRPEHLPTHDLHVSLQACWIMALECLTELTCISKMDFSRWKPPGGSERMWRVNFDATISDQYQSLRGQSDRPSEQLGSLMTGTGVPWKWLW